MAGSNCLFLFCLLLCLYSITAKSLCQGPNDDACKLTTSQRQTEMAKETTAAVLKDLPQVHEHELLSTLSGVEHFLHHTNITGFQECVVEKMTLGETTSSMDFDVFCPHIYIRSRECIYSVRSSEGLGKCHYCLNNYVLKFKTEIGSASGEDSGRYFIKDSSFTFEQRGTTSDNSNICQNDYEDGLSQENRLTLSEAYHNQVLTSSARKILENLDKSIRS